MLVPGLSLTILFTIAANNCVKSDMSPITNINIKEAVGLWFNDRNVALQTYGSMSGWDTSDVTDMGWLFEPSQNITNDDDFDISSWNVSAVTNMAGMFFGASSFNQDISSWDVSSVVFMGLMFVQASSFNQNIASWDVSSAQRTNFMFEAATSFNQDIGNWDVSSVELMDGMFEDASSFNQDISSWNVSSVKQMHGMFRGASSFNQDLNTWNLSSIQEMGVMFYDATSFEQSVCWTGLDIPFSGLQRMFCKSKGEFDIECESSKNYFMANTGCIGESSPAADSMQKINMQSFASALAVSLLISVFGIY